MSLYNYCKIRSTHKKFILYIVVLMTVILLLACSILNRNSAELNSLPTEGKHSIVTLRIWDQHDGLDSQFGPEPQSGWLRGQGMSGMALPAPYNDNNWWLDLIDHNGQYYGVVIIGWDNVSKQLFIACRTWTSVDVQFFYNDEKVEVFNHRPKHLQPISSWERIYKKFKKQNSY